RLKNGDIVEIVRNAAHKPSRDWLNFAVTSRARNKIKHLIQVEEKERAVELGRRVFEKEARRFGLNGTKPDRIKVRGADDVMVFRAKCCNPIRGEKIVGYITRGKGVSVHAAKCANVINLMYDPMRKIDVEWDKGSDIHPYTVRLAIEVEDRKGMLAQLSQKIADINTNITNVEARTGDQRGRIDVTVEIKDVKHLEQVIKSVRGVAGVLNVERKAEVKS